MTVASWYRPTVTLTGTTKHVEIYVDNTPPARSTFAHQTGLEIRRTAHPDRIRKPSSGLTQVGASLPALNNINDPINRQKH